MTEILEYLCDGRTIHTQANTPGSNTPQWSGDTVVIKGEPYKVMARAGEKVFVTKVEGGD